MGVFQRQREKHEEGCEGYLKRGEEAGGHARGDAGEGEEVQREGKRASQGEEVSEGYGGDEAGEGCSGWGG